MLVTYFRQFILVLLTVGCPTLTASCRAALCQVDSLRSLALVMFSHPEDTRTYTTVQEGAHGTRQESLVSLDSREELPREDKFNVLARDSGPTLSERVLLHNDTALLGLDFMKELAVETPQVGAHVPVDVVLDQHMHVPEPSARAGF